MTRPRVVASRSGEDVVNAKMREEGDHHAWFTATHALRTADGVMPLNSDDRDDRPTSVVLKPIPESVVLALLSRVAKKGPNGAST